MQAENEARPGEAQASSSAQELVGRIQQALKADEMEAARRECDLLAQEPGQQAEAEHLLGLVELGVGRYGEALPRLEAALSLQGDRPDMWANHGAALAMLGEAEKAVTSLQRAVELDPEYEDALLNLGDLLLRTGQREESLRILHRAVQIRPSARSFALLSQCVHQQGDAESAETVALAGYNLGPEDQDTRQELIRMLVLLGRHGEASLLAEGAQNG